MSRGRKDAEPVILVKNLIPCECAFVVTLPALLSSWYILDALPSLKSRCFNAFDKESRGFKS